MGRLCIRYFFAALFLLTVGQHASGSVIYRYTGNSYATATSPYDTSMNLIATIELPSLLPPNLSGVDQSPLSFSVFDGLHTLTESTSNADLAYFSFSTDSNGEIVGWGFEVVDQPETVSEQGIRMVSVLFAGTLGESGTIFECSVISSTGICLSEVIVASGATSGSSDLAGSWSVIPVPGALLLFASGIIALASLGKRRSRAG